MSTPAPDSYRIADEIESFPARRAKKPWSPLGLFLLTFLFAPIGALMFGINWARLGFPERRASIFAAGVLALLLPIGIALYVQAMNLPIERATWRPLVSFVSIAIAYWQLLGQRQHFDSHLARGGESAHAGWLWLMALLSIVLMFAVAFIRVAG